MEERKEEERKAKVGEAIKGWFSTVSTRVKVASQTSRLRYQISLLKTRRREILREVGEKVYALYQKGKVGNPDIVELCKQVEEIDKEVEERQREIERIREEAGLVERAAPAEVSEEPLEKEGGKTEQG